MMGHMSHNDQLWRHSWSEYQYFPEKRLISTCIYTIYQVLWPDDVIVGHYDSYDPSSWSVSHKLQDEHHDVMITSSFPVTSGLKLTGSDFHGVFRTKNFLLISLPQKVVRYMSPFCVKTAKLLLRSKNGPQLLYFWTKNSLICPYFLLLIDF